MNTIEQFNRLKSSLNIPVIPDLILAEVEIIPSTSLISLDEFKLIFDQFDPDCGWVLYRDVLSTDIVDFSRKDIIEGEWCKPNNSLRLRMIEPGKYHLTHCLQKSGNTQAYQDLKISLQPVSGHTLATYRIWWECEIDGPRQGRWEPLYQQFIGFDLGE